MAVSVSIIGSSFTARFRSYVNDPLCRSRRNLGLNNAFARVYTDGIPGLQVSGLPQFDTHLAYARPDIVIIHCGGNDLAHKSSLTVAMDLYDFANHLVRDFGVEHVIVCSTLKRFSTNKDGTLKFGITPDQFAAKADDLNFRLANVFDDNHLHFWEMTSLHGPITSITGIGKDGVHLSRDPGLKKYFREMRGIILRYGNRMHAANNWVQNY